MKKVIYILAIATIFGACQNGPHAKVDPYGPSVDTYVPDNFTVGSVSPRAEQRYSNSFAGHQNISGTNEDSKFQPSDVIDLEKRQKILDTINRGYSGDDGHIYMQEEKQVKSNKN